MLLEEPDESTIRDALRLPEQREGPTPATDADDWASSETKHPDMFIPILSVGSFAGFGAIIANEYVERRYSNSRGSSSATSSELPLII